MKPIARAARVTNGWGGAVALLFCAAVASACAAWQTGEHVNLHRLVVYADGAVYANAPVRFVAPGVAEMDWSSDGRYLLLQRRVEPQPPAERTKSLLLGLEQVSAEPPPTAQQFITIWNASTRHATDVWTQNSPHEYVSHTGWLPGTRTLLIAISEPQSKEGLYPNSIYRVDGAAGRLEPVIAVNNLRALWISPTRAVSVVLAGNRRLPINHNTDGAIAESSSDYEWYVRTVRAVGAPGAAVIVPAPLQPYSIDTDSDGNPIVRCLQSDSLQLRPATPVWLRYDIASNQLIELEHKPALFKSPAGVTGQLVCSIAEARTGARPHTAVLHALWLVGSEPGPLSRALIAEGATVAKLAPGAGHIAWASDDMVGVCSLIHLSKEELALAAEGPIKAATIGDAKQMAIAMLMYCEDYDEQMPAASGDQSAEVASQYLKDTGILGGFFYTFGGGPLSSVDYPAGTEIGYMPGLGGSAIVYLDGHVKWRSNPP